MAHGSFNFTDLEEGCLTLAGMRQILGEDIAAIDIKALAVVLHACSTTRGQLTADTVLGISHSLMMAGVPCCIATLWNANAKAAVEHARCLYEYLRARGQGMRQC